MITQQNVAEVLESEAGFTIAEWLSCVDSEPEILTIQLTSEERSAHLPEMLRDIVIRLCDPLPLGSRALTSDAAHDHGCLRRKQGYTPAMMVEESRMLQVSIFHTLQLNREQLDFRVVMMDVMTIADEVDSQLAQAMVGYMSGAKIDAQPVEA